MIKTFMPLNVLLPENADIMKWNLTSALIEENDAAVNQA